MLNRVVPNTDLQFPVTPTVAASYAGALTAFLATRGLQFGAGARPGSEAAPRRVCGPAYAGLLIQGMRDLDDKTLGLSFGTAVGGAGFGLLGIAAATAPTLAAAIHHLVTLESITSTLGRATVRRSAGVVHLEWLPVHGVPPILVEGILSGWVSFGRYLLGEPVEVLQVAFAHPRAAAHGAYDDTLACPVRFNAARYCVSLSAELLAARPRQADPVLNALMSGWMGHCAAAVGTANNVFTRKVAATLGTVIPFAEAEQGAVAQRLGMGTRTLQRRLRQEGTTFRQVLDAARAQHAIIGLLSGVSPSLLALCASAGFDEQSSLCRAFQHWTGHAPLALRSRLSEVFSQLRPEPPAPGSGQRAWPSA